MDPYRLKIPPKIFSIIKSPQPNLLTLPALRRLGTLLHPGCMHLQWAMSRGHAKFCKHTLAMRKNLRKMPKCWSHTPVVGKCLWDAPKCRLHTPAVGKCLWHVLKHSPGWLHLLLRAVKHTFWPLVTSEIAKRHIFYLLCIKPCPPGGQI